MENVGKCVVETNSYYFLHWREMEVFDRCSRVIIVHTYMLYCISHITCDHSPSLSPFSLPPVLIYLSISHG
jgi:hypothetical protein